MIWNNQPGPKSTLHFMEAEKITITHQPYGQKDKASMRVATKYNFYTKPLLSIKPNIGIITAMNI